MNGKPGMLVAKISFICNLRVTLPDTLKGSYYANYAVSDMKVSPEHLEAYPEYYGKNICKNSSRLA